jgi:hypothetical protein
MESREFDTPDLEVDVGAIIAVLERHGVAEGQPEQVAGRWVEAGFEDPGEIERLLERGFKTPEDARASVKRSPAPTGERHYDQGSEPRDVVRGTTHSRSRPGDELEQEPQQPGSPPYDAAG